MKTLGDLNSQINYSAASGTRDISQVKERII